VEFAAVHLLLPQPLSERVEGATPEAMAAPMQYEWPGNVRELRNVIESMFVDPPSTIAADHLPE
jgi:transcriptional regulator with PAS, ATPase and Fis domain